MLFQLNLFATCFAHLVLKIELSLKTREQIRFQKRVIRAKYFTKKMNQNFN